MPPNEPRRKKRTYGKIAPLVAAALLVPMFVPPQTAPVPEPTAAASAEPAATPVPTPAPTPEATAEPEPGGRVTFVSFESQGVLRVELREAEDITDISYTVRDEAIDAELERRESIPREQYRSGILECAVSLGAIWDKFSDRYAEGQVPDVWIDVYLTHADGRTETLRSKCDGQDYVFWAWYKDYAGEIEAFVYFSPDRPVPEIVISDDPAPVTKTKFCIWLYGADFDADSVRTETFDNRISVTFPIRDPAAAVEMHMWLRLKGSDELFDYKTIVPIEPEGEIS